MIKEIELLKKKLSRLSIADDDIFKILKMPGDISKLKLKAYREANALRQEVSKIISELENKYFISHKQTCELLKEETGKEWKTLDIKGLDYFKLLRYGIAYASENSELSKSSSAAFSLLDTPTNSDDFLVIHSGVISSNELRDKRQDELRNYNMMKYYINLICNDFNYNSSEFPDPQKKFIKPSMKEKLLRNSFDHYFEKLSENENNDVTSGNQNNKNQKNEMEFSLDYTQSDNDDHQIEI